MAKQTRTKRKAEGTSRKASAGLKKAKPVTVKAVPEEKSSENLVLPPAWRIGWRALGLLWRYRALFVVIGAVYLLLDLLLVKSVTAFNVGDLKDSLDSSLTHGAGAVIGGVSVFASIFAAAASGTSEDAAGGYHFFLVTFMSLVVIWSLHQVFANGKTITAPTTKAAFYRSATPLVPFILLLMLAGLQFIPLLFGLEVYSIVSDGGVVSSSAEQLLFMALLLALAVLTVHWLTRTAVALYIVTLPNKQPLQAYREAKELVRGHRLSLIRKFLFLPFAMFIIAAGVMVPLILIWAPLAQWFFFGLTAVGFIAMHAYFYTIYRELSHE